MLELTGVQCGRISSVSGWQTVFIIQSGGQLNLDSAASFKLLCQTYHDQSCCSPTDSWKKSKKKKPQRAFVFEQVQDKAGARGKRIHLIWSQLAAHAYRNGQWGKGKCLPPLSFPLSPSPCLLACFPQETRAGGWALWWPSVTFKPLPSGSLRGGLCERRWGGAQRGPSEHRERRRKKK